MSQSTLETLQEDLAEPISHASEQAKSYFREHPQRSIWALLALVGLVALGVWGWPELRRTIQMHSM